ncbi:MAG: ATP-dependent 6-phosphofructokinase [Pseudomonadota bacterium]
MTRPKRIAINTGGGDAPGLNAVIRAATLAAIGRGWEVYGIKRSYAGLLRDEDEGLVPLNRRVVRGITHLGGTILGTTNRGDPFAYPVVHADGSVELKDVSARIVERLGTFGFDALIAIGGDGSLRIAQKLSELGVPVIGVPKTIDNDLASTVVTFGLDTALNTAVDAIDKLHSTAESHERVMVVELMGRNCGWIALNAGLASTADAILIPEIPFDLDKVANAIMERQLRGRHFAIIVVSEGAYPVGSAPFHDRPQAVGGMKRLGGIGEWVADELATRTGKETRSLVLGHLQRGGSPTAFDRELALRFGAAAVRFVEAGHFGTMVALHPPQIVPVPLTEATAALKTVPLDSDKLQTARDLGVCLGD